MGTMDAAKIMGCTNSLIYDCQRALLDSLVCTIFHRSILSQEIPLLRAIVSTKMMPTEAFAEVVAFLRLCDLCALAVTTRCVLRLHAKPLTGFDGKISRALTLSLRTDGSQFLAELYTLMHVDGSLRWPFVADLTFPSEIDTTEFVSASFANGVFECVTFAGSPSKQLLKAIGRVADSVIVKGSLSTILSHAGR